MTRRENKNQWSGGIAAHPTQKIPSAKIRCKSSRLDVLASRRHPPHWLSSKGPNCQRGVLLVSAAAIERHFEGKTPLEEHQGGSCFCTSSPGPCNPEETGIPGLPMSWSPTLFSGSGPVELPSVPWTEKKLKYRHISFYTEVIVAAVTLLDGQHCECFFNVLQKLEQRVKKCIELRWEYVE